MAVQKSIGELIEKEVRRQGMSIVGFAERINCQRNNVYDLFKRNKIDIIQLKRISIVLNRNFFKELADDLDLISDCDESEEERYRRKAISQFYEVVPVILHKLGRYTAIIFDKSDGTEYEGYPVPDFCLPDYLITFTIGETLEERMGYNPLLSFSKVSNSSGCIVEICTNKICNTKSINIKLDYMTEDQWYCALALAFEVYESLKRR